MDFLLTIGDEDNRDKRRLFNEPFQCRHDKRQGGLVFIGLFLIRLDL